MTPDSVGPLSRPMKLHQLAAGGSDVTVVATPAECATLAADLGLVGIDHLEGRLRVASAHDRIRVTGRVQADIRQTCTVSLDEFASRFDEEVEVEFTVSSGRRDDVLSDEVEADLDAPDELVGDHIDLGAITAEFLALGLDPHPRKPGVAFDYAPDPEEGGASSPFAALARLKDPGG